jgi:hypothetical protein
MRGARSDARGAMRDARCAMRDARGAMRYVVNPQKLCRYTLILDISYLMLWIAQVVAISFIIIFILHNLYFFFKETLTVPKMKDMVKRPQQRYDALFRELRMHSDAQRNDAQRSDAQRSDAQRSDAQRSDVQRSDVQRSDVPTNANDEMKNELKRYLMELNGSNTNTTLDPHSQSQSQPQSHSLSNSNFIELGSAYQ